MHILMVSEYFTPHGMGGGELSALALAKALVRKQHNVSVLTSGFSGDRAFETIEGVQIYRRLVTGKNPDSFKGNIARLKLTRSIKSELPKLIKEINPDVIQAMNITSMTGVAQVAQSTGIKAIAHINSPLAFDPKATLLDGGKERQEPYTFSSFIRSFISSREMGRLGNSWYLRCNPLIWALLYRRWAAIRNSFPAFAHFFPISTAMQDWLVKSGVPKEKTTVLYNIIPLDTFAKLSPGKNSIPAMLYIGGYVKYKGLHILIEALRGLAEPFTLDIYGKGPERAALEAQANGMKLAFHDELPNKDLPKVVAAHDILLFPSQVPEGLGRVAIEAMAASKPVIASDIGGMKDTVITGVTGILVTPDDVSAWRTAIVKLLKDAKARAQFGRAGKQRAMSLFSEDTIITQAITTYEKVLA